jgi:DNA-binding transcriptional regulator YiaG
MVVRMKDYKKLHKEWVEGNPLRQYRIKNKITLNVAASMLSVGVYTVQRWEGGVVFPKEENMKKLSKLIGEDAENQWQEWMNKKPKL